MTKDAKVSVADYYRTRESRWGYLLLLGGTKHFGYYEAGDKPWQFKKALRRMEAELVKELDVSSGDIVLDAGCGMGDVASYVAKHTDAKIHGIDILDFNIKEACKRTDKRGLSGQLKFSEMNYETLDFPDDSFDAVYTMETFVHANDPDKVLKEFHRVLKPNGKLVQFEYSHAPANELTNEADEAIRTVNRFSSMPTFQRLNHGDHEKLLEKNGYKVQRTRMIMKNIEPMLRIFSILAAGPYALLQRLGYRNKIVNAMSAVEFWKHRKFIHYNIIISRKK